MWPGALAGEFGVGLKVETQMSLVTAATKLSKQCFLRMINKHTSVSVDVTGCFQCQELRHCPAKAFPEGSLGRSDGGVQDWWR